jgi:hypothetical protein
MNSTTKATACPECVETELPYSTSMTIHIDTDEIAATVVCDAGGHTATWRQSGRTRTAWAPGAREAIVEAAYEEASRVETNVRGMMGVGTYRVSR